MLALAAALGIGRFAMTPLLPPMQAAAHLTDSQAGVLASANYAGYLAGALLLTLIVPRRAGRLLLGLGLAGVVATTALMAATTSFAAWGAIRFLSGLASAGVFILASDAVLAALRRASQTARSGCLYGGAGGGIVASGLIAHAATGRTGWRDAWLVLAVLAAIAAYPAWRWLPPRSDESARIGSRPPARTPVLAMPLALLLAAYTLAGGGYIVTATFLVVIVERLPGLAGDGWAVWVVVGLAALPSTVLWVAASRRIGPAPTLALVYFIQGCGIGLPALSGGAAVAGAAALLFGGTFMAIPALTLVLAGPLAPGRSTAVIGLLTTGFGSGQIVAPPLAGLVAGRTHDFGPALIAASAAVLLGGVLVTALGRLWQHPVLGREGEKAL